MAYTVHDRYWRCRKRERHTKVGAVDGQSVIISKRMVRLLWKLLSIKP